MNAKVEESDEAQKITAATHINFWFHLSSIFLLGLRLCPREGNEWQRQRPTIRHRGTKRRQEDSVSEEDEKAIILIPEIH